MEVSTLDYVHCPCGCGSIPEDCLHELDPAVRGKIYIVRGQAEGWRAAEGTASSP